MHRKSAHSWRAIATAALLLFAAGQLIEQSHLHESGEASCAVCTHTDGQDGVLSAASAETDRVPVFATADRLASPPLTQQTRLQQQPRGPPVNLS